MIDALGAMFAAALICSALSVTEFFARRYRSAFIWWLAVVLFAGAMWRL